MILNCVLRVLHGVRSPAPHLWKRFTKKSLFVCNVLFSGECTVLWHRGARRLRLSLHQPPRQAQDQRISRDPGTGSRRSCNTSLTVFCSVVWFCIIFCCVIVLCRLCISSLLPRRPVWIGCQQGWWPQQRWISGFCGTHYFLRDSNIEMNYLFPMVFFKDMSASNRCISRWVLHTRVGAPCTSSSAPRRGSPGRRGSAGSGWRLSSLPARSSFESQLLLTSFDSFGRLQVITAEQLVSAGNRHLPLPPALATFGSSLDGGMDMDSNGYPGKRCKLWSEVKSQDTTSWWYSKSDKMDLNRVSHTLWYCVLGSRKC